MKNILALFFLIMINLTALAQLNWLNPKPSGFNNQKLSFNGNMGYLMNLNGDLFITSDTGTSWQLKKNFPSSQAFSIHDSTGIVPSLNASVYLSTNNGNTWTKRSTGISGYLENWTDIVGRDTIFLLKGGGTTLYKSINRGLNWVSVNTNMPALYLNTIDFITSMRGYASGAQGIFKTTDGGASWQNMYATSTSNNITCIKFRDTATGFAYLENSGIMKTVNGGVSWSAFSTTSEVTDICWSSADHAFAAGPGGYIVKTIDAGLTWTQTNPSGLAPISDLVTQYFLNDSTGIIAGSRGSVIKTVDGGNSWKSYAPTYIDITTIAFGDSLTGYASTWNRLYKTVDTGQNWTALALQVGNGVSNFSRFEQAYFWSRDTGILTASLPARIYKTKDGGQHWDSIYPIPANHNAFDNIRALSFINKDTGFIEAYTSGSDGVFKTTNGGDSWQLVSSNQYFTRMQFVNSQLGFGTRSGQLLRTVNGGVNWSYLTIPTTDYLNDLWFTSPSKGFIIYNSNYIKMTLDSGHTWTNVVNVITAINNNYKTIKFFDQNIGYMADNESYIYKTIDGGLNWGIVGNVATACSLIYFQPDSTVFLGGINGCIVSTTPNSYHIDSLGAAEICQNGNITLTAAMPNGFSYKWQLKTGGVYTDIANGVNYSGVNTSLLHLNNIPSSWYGNQYRCIVNGTNSEEYAIRFVNRWTGAINSSWENTGNWSCGVLPDSNTDVIIGSGNVILNSNTTIRSLVLSPGVTFTINPPYNLTILH